MTQSPKLSFDSQSSHQASSSCPVVVMIIAIMSFGTSAKQNSKFKLVFLVSFQRMLFVPQQLICCGTYFFIFFN